LYSKLGNKCCEEETGERIGEVRLCEGIKHKFGERTFQVKGTAFVIVQMLGTVSHAYNCSCSGGKDPKSYSVRPAEEESSQDRISTNKFQAWWCPSVIPTKWRIIVSASLRLV
jgi:hypothetical protein